MSTTSYNIQQNQPVLKVVAPSNCETTNLFSGMSSQITLSQFADGQENMAWIGPGS
jgi:hypothetical protein